MIAIRVRYCPRHKPSRLPTRCNRWAPPPVRPLRIHQRRKAQRGNSIQIEVPSAFTRAQPDSIAIQR